MKVRIFTDNLKQITLNKILNADWVSFYGENLFECLIDGYSYVLDMPYFNNKWKFVENPLMTRIGKEVELTEPQFEFLKLKLL